eukprot:Skav235500  [mRNA]  locus=scaffold3432:23399:30233:- [translate_table: standard]
MKADSMYTFHQVQYDKILEYNIHELQQWVRRSFLCVPVDRRSRALKSFIEMVVLPCTGVNVTATVKTKPQLLQAQALFSSFLESGDASVMDQIAVQIAQASISGRLHNHPVLQGLTLSTMKMQDPQERGLSLAGRDAKNTPLATEEGRMLVSEAGSTLAILGCNAEVLRRFGQNAVGSKKLGDMTSKSLPTAMLALGSKEVLKQNIEFIDQQLSATSHMSGCGSEFLSRWSMLEFLMWDPMSRQQLCLPAAEMPVNIADLDGVFMLETLDRFMAWGAADYVKVICFDGHGPMGHIKFSNDSFSVSPRRKTISHSSKNSGSQAQSCLRTLYLGRFFVDLSGAVQAGLPASAYARDDPQSDLTQALLCNPFFYVGGVDIDAPELCQVLWQSRGALLWSLSVALSVAPLFHKKMTLKERTELSVSGYVLWDLWCLLAAKKEASEQAFVGSFSMARETVTNLQQLSLSLATMADDWSPWSVGNARLSEISIEQLFGRLRRSTANAQLTPMQFWQSSQREMLHAWKRCARDASPIEIAEPPLSEAEFAACCKNGYDGALQLAAWAGSYTVESLKSYYEESCASGWFEQSTSHAPEFLEEESDDEETVAREMSGNVVLYITPEHQISLGVVLVVWRVGKKKKPAANSCSVETCKYSLPELVDSCKFNLTEESLEAWSEAKEKVAEDWRSSFLGPDVDLSKTKRKRRPRCFKTASRALRKAKQASAKAKAAPKKKSAKAKKSKSVMEAKPIEPIAQNYGRTDKGRKLIRQQMEALLQIDIEKNPSKPAFEPNGACRLKFPGAQEGQTWSKLVAKSPIYFEATYAAKDRTGFGTAVALQIDTLRKQLLRGDRSPWLRFLRALCEMPVPDTM